MTLGAIFMLRLRANFRVDKPARFCYTAFCCAGVAHLVERHLAKVEVAGSSPVARSTAYGGGCAWSMSSPSRYSKILIGKESRV